MPVKKSPHYTSSLWTILSGIFILIPLAFLASCTKNAAFTGNNSIAPGVNFYVDGKAGINTNDGRSPATAWKTIQQAASHALAGSIVLIRAGTYSEQVVLNVSGTAAYPIVFKNYENEAVVLDGSGFTSGTMLSVIDKSYLSFSGLTIQNLTGKDVQGVLVEARDKGGVANITFRHMLIQGISWTKTSSTAPGSTDNAQPFIAYGKGSSEAAAMTGILLDSSEVRNNTPGFSEAISLDGNIDGFIVSNTSVHDNSNIGIAAQGNYGTSTNPLYDQARNGSITGNTTFNNLATYATSAGIYIDGGKNITITRNRSYQNGNGIEVGNEQNGSASGIIVAGNLLYFNQEAGLAIGGYTTQTSGQVLASSVHNNTFFQNNSLLDGTGEMVITKASGCTIENNIFCTNTQNLLLTLTPILPQSGNSLNYNCWYTPSGNAASLQINWLNLTYTSFTSYQTATGQESSSLFTVPGFTAPGSLDFHLLPSSSCKNAGDITVIKNAAETDVDGNLLIQSGVTSMGAFH